MRLLVVRVRRGRHWRFAPCVLFLLHCLKHVALVLIASFLLDDRQGCAAEVLLSNTRLRAFNFLLDLLDRRLV